MKIFLRSIAICLCIALAAYGQGNTFDRVRYNGGSVSSKVDPKDWKNTLVVTSDKISLKLKDGVSVDIDPKTVTSISYGQEAHRRVGTMVALAVLVAPVALFGLFHKTRLHYIGIQYAAPDTTSKDSKDSKSSEKKTAGILLQGDKDNYRAILVALQGVTGIPVSVGEKDREFVPVGVKTDVSKTKEEEPTEAKPTADSAKGMVNVTSNPAGADVNLDGDFVGNTPSALKLAPGKHTIAVKLKGYKDWSREINVQSGSELQLTANLEKVD